MFNYLLCHVDTFAIHIPIYSPKLLSGFLLFQQPTILATINAIGTAPRIISLSMRLFQGSHNSDVSTKFDPMSGGSRDPSAVSPIVGQPLVLSAVLANHMCTSADG